MSNWFKRVGIPFCTTALLFLLFSFSQLSAQENSGENAETPSAEEEDLLPVKPEIKVTPVFPDSEEGLIYIEGEDAVSTNFSTSAVYNYGASAFRSLQLIQQNAPYGGRPYYAEYAFYAEEAGDYYFWYGGTPSGPKEDVYPSYASPFRYTLDDQTPVPVYRENLAVVQAYTPSYYWMQVGKVSLTQGVHKIRIEVPEKRRFDGQYYFFLDSFFFLREDLIDKELEKVPARFPRDRMNRSIDNPFQSVSYYEDVIRENPGNKNAYIVLSMIYSLLGDYINAIKNLNSAVNLDSKDPYPLLLMAKNRIWNGEVTAGLNLYQQLLVLAPDNPSYWAEAGKVAAWTGMYRESLDFFNKGLKRFPDDLNLKVNLGLTYLWMSRSKEADQTFLEAEKSTRGDHERTMELGNTHSLSGYPAFAAEIYKNEISDSPEFLETYLALEQAYRNSGERDRADNVIKLIYDTFEESEEFFSYMDVYEEKVRMKEGILDGYRQALKENPDNISLRQELAQTYFWNGLREEAVDESLRVLINKMYLVFRDFDTKAEGLLTLRDELSYLGGRFNRIFTAYSDAGKELDSAYSTYMKALKASEKKPDDQELAKTLDSQSVLYSRAFNNAVLWTDRLAEQERILEDFSQEWNDLAAEEVREEVVFQQLLGESEWSWDRNFTQQELREVQRDEPLLSQYILGRLALIEGRKDEAARYLNSPVFKADPPGRYALFQTWLWQGNRDKQISLWETEADVLTLYRQHLFDQEALSWDETSEEGGYYIPSAEDIASLTKILSDRSRKFSGDLQKLLSLEESIEKALDSKLNRQIYNLEQETYLLRYELGNYYLDMDENIKASGQFYRVLAMDPWNISANYKLGVVSQRYGNWSRAMDQYKKVYYQNSNYENAAHYYNQLARANADNIHISSQNITDPSVISYRSNVEYASLINNRLGWGFTYQLDVDRQYKAFNGQDPSSYKLHTLAFNVPVSFPEWNLTVTPLGGFYLSNDYFNEDAGSGTVDISDYIDARNVEALAGAGIAWEYDFLNTDLSYRYELEEDSLFADRNLTRSHTFELTASTYFPLATKDFWGPVATRTYGSLQFLQGEGDGPSNRISQFLQELSVGYVVSQKPFIRLTANGIFNYENGEDPDVIDYYTPENVMEAKGGLRGTMSFHNAAYTENLEMSLWGSGGGYWTDQEDTASPALKLEGQFSVYYVKNDMTLYMMMGANGTFDEGISAAAQYWELSATLGCRVNVPSLLIP